MIFTRRLIALLIAILAHGAACAEGSPSQSNTLAITTNIPVLTPTITIDHAWELPFKDGKLNGIRKAIIVRGNGALALSIKKNAFLKRVGGAETIALSITLEYGNADKKQKLLGTHRGRFVRAALNYADANTDLGRHHPLHPADDRKLLVEPATLVDTTNTRAGTYTGAVELVLEAGEDDLAIYTPII